MMKGIKLLILIASAVAGMIYYQRYHALSNIIGDTPVANTKDGTASSTNPSGGIGKIGGLGPVGPPSHQATRPFSSSNE